MDGFCFELHGVSKVEGSELLRESCRLLLALCLGWKLELFPNWIVSSDSKEVSFGDSWGALEVEFPDGGSLRGREAKVFGGSDGSLLLTALSPFFPACSTHLLASISISNPKPCSLNL